MVLCQLLLVKFGLSHLREGHGWSGLRAVEKRRRAYGRGSNGRLEKTACCGASWFAFLISYYSRVQIKKNEMGGACSVYKEEEKCVDGFGGES
jgi:hypothetical protein